jgi:hypothetical protein
MGEWIPHGDGGIYAAGEGTVQLIATESICCVAIRTRACGSPVRKVAGASTAEAFVR